MPSSHNEPMVTTSRSEDQRCFAAAFLCGVFLRFLLSKYRPCLATGIWAIPCFLASSSAWLLASKCLAHRKPKSTKCAVCDCGRYRKVVGQLDITVARLKSSMKFVKNVLAGIRETEEKYYYIVQEEKSYKEALTHCRIRDGILAMPKDEAANAVISDYISKSGLFRVFIGVNDLDREGHFMYADCTPLQNYSNWKEGEPDDTSGQEDCVEMLSTGKWNDTECHLTMFFVCEFPKKRK